MKVLRLRNILDVCILTTSTSFLYLCEHLISLLDRVEALSTYTARTWRAYSGTSCMLCYRTWSSWSSACSLTQRLCNTIRQESYFHYIFGVENEDCYGALDIRDGKTILFMPRLPDSYAV